MVLLGLEVDGPCSGGCALCPRSQIGYREGAPLVSKLTEDQTAAVHRILSLYAPNTEPVHLSIETCLSRLAEDFTLDPLHSSKVAKLHVNISSMQIDAEELREKLEKLLAQFPEISSLAIGLGRGKNKLDQQLQLLTKFLPLVTDMLTPERCLQDVQIILGANDLRDTDEVFDFYDRAWEPMEKALDIDPYPTLREVPIFSKKFHHIRTHEPQMAGAQEGDLINLAFIFHPSEETFKTLVIACASSISNPTHMTPQRAMCKLSGITEPSFHLGPNKAFLYHHPQLATTPGMHIDYSEFFECLGYIEQGSTLEEVVIGSILKHSLWK